MNPIPNALAIPPIPHPLQTAVHVPGSKSITNRALLIAALADGSTTLANALFSDDSHYFADSLARLGFDVQSNEPNARISVVGCGGRLPAKSASLFVGNAGTAARFLTAMLTLGQGEYILDGDARMHERPIGDLITALAQLGARIESLDKNRASASQAITPTTSLKGGRELSSSPKGGETGVKAGCLPLRVLANGLPGGAARIAGDASSQFLSGLLMTAPYAQKPVELIVERGLNSKPYVDMTLSVMADFGVRVQRDDYERFLIPAQHYQARNEYIVESDASAATYFFAAPAICGGSVRVQNISRRSIQGDVAFVDVLAQMGCAVITGDDWIEVHGPSHLSGVDVDMRNISDAAQTLAAIAPFASTPTTIRGIGFIRKKETDRVAAMVAELRRLGVPVTEQADGLIIQPCANLQPATIHTYNDHRMAMAFALVGLRVPGIAIENPGCVSKTFPNFFSVLDQLRY